MTPELNPLQPRSIDLPTSVLLSHTEDLTILDGAKILAGPDKPAYRPAWRWALERWRDGARPRIGYSDELYQDPALSWTRRCYSVCLVGLWDELLCDHETGRFTPQAFVEAARRDLGGFDAIVLWQAYPVIGIDERNQFDFYRDVVELPELVHDLHHLGLRVWVDYGPWDVGTGVSLSPTRWLWPRSWQTSEWTACSLTR